MHPCTGPNVLHDHAPRPPVISTKAEGRVEKSQPFNPSKYSSCK